MRFTDARKWRPPVERLFRCHSLKARRPRQSIKESFLPRVRGKFDQARDFSGRKESPRDVVTRKLRANVFEVDADLPDRCEGIEGESTRMRQIEFQLLVLTDCSSDSRLAV